MKLADLIDPFQKADGPPPQTLRSFFGWCLSGAWPVLLIAAFFSALAGSLEVVSAYILGSVVDIAVQAGPEGFFGTHAVLLLACVAFFLVIRPILFGLSAASSAILVFPNVFPLAHSRLNRWTLSQPISFFEADFAGRISQKQMQTARAVTDVTMEMINVVAFALASIIGTIFLLITIDQRIALVLGVWLIAYIVLLRWFLPRIRVRSKARAGARAAVTGQVVDAVTNVKTVKLFAHDAHEDQAALNSMEIYRQKGIKFGQLSAGFRLSLMTLAGFLPVALIGGVLFLWSQGNTTPGDVAAAGTVSVRIAQMTGWVSFALLAMYGNIGEIEDGMATLTPRPTLVDAPDAQELNSVTGAVQFKDVSFQYGRKSGGIRNLNLTLQPGEKIGIVGASGAGKSTLVNLLLRLYAPEQGSVSVDGHNLERVTQESLRKNIGMVTQETGLFNRSALENIRYGTPEASLVDVRNAARKSQALEFIEGLEDHAGRKAFDAHLGERGVKLSGGQRQRIALARAILKDAPILVLDEATSALDSESEALIQTALGQAMEGKTVLSIAHRLSTLSQMDRIIVLEDGGIVESGQHEGLLAQNGLYARFWRHQSGGFLGVQEAAE